MTPLEKALREAVEAYAVAHKGNPSARRDEINFRHAEMAASVLFGEHADELLSLVGERRWIPIEDGEPPVGHHLVMCKGDNIPSIEFHFGMNCWDEYAAGPEVTHWMPLPAPPQEDEK